MASAHQKSPIHDNGIFCFICRLWTPIDGEFDDYIVNPKPSGYQVRFPPVVLLQI